MLLRRSAYQARIDVELVSKKNLSPQIIKKPSTIVVHKYPQSHQHVKIDHVENGQEG